MAEINRCGAALLPLAVALIGCSLVAAGAVTGRGSARRLLVDNGLARTPQMGWNSWNHFGCDINETAIRSTVDALVSSGLTSAGYTYVNLDDCWADNQRTKEGYLAANPEKFPSGIKALSDYVHSKGLKLGLYSSAGTRTCSNRMPGSLGHEDTDAKTFASWGVDYLKYDNCYRDDSNELVRFPRMSHALRNSGRSIFYSLCEWGYMDVATWGGSYGNSWRTTGDINDTWTSILNNIDQNDAYAKYAKPGGWNDPDMLEVGNGGLTHDEYIVHFSLWAIAKAPLIIGCDVTGISKDTLGILSNPEVIAINQDRLGIQGRRVRKYDDEIEVWAGRLSGHRKAVLLLNRGATSRRSITATWADVGLRRGVAAEARDVWKHETLPGRFAGRLTAEVGPHSCKLFILTPVGR
ncbi:hypothetical protein ACQ4PT_036565 [Festuca glaucescens]